MQLIDYIDRLYIINLPERIDRYEALKRELLTLGIDIAGERVRIPQAPRPQDKNDFFSRGVYGNFLSHLGILEEALQDNLETVWVLEDDAIFSHRLRKKFFQDEISKQLATTNWDLCYIGHSLKKQELAAYPKGLVESSLSFIWAHCYIVNRSVLEKLVKYLQITLENPVGDPYGGKMYIDGAFTLFRQLHPEVITLISNPCLSIQKGSPSNLAVGRNWYDHLELTKYPVALARSIRDELWRWQ